MSHIPEPVEKAPAPPAEAREIFGDRLELAGRYADLLATTGISHGLVGPREAPRLWERHLVNCALIESLLPTGAHVIDIGSGAGLPGIVLAIARPDLQIDLVEPLLRRTVWLKSTIEALELPHIRVHRGRAEESGLTAPFVTARAVASLDKLIRWTFPLLEPNGRLLALKGEAAAAELAAAQKLLRRLGVERAELRVIGQDRVSEPVRVVDIEVPRGHHPRGDRQRGAGEKADAGGIGEVRGKKKVPQWAPGPQSRDKTSRMRSKSS